MPGGNQYVSAITAKVISATVRRRDAVNLRVMGLSYREVFDALVQKYGREALPPSYDERNCYKDIAFELKRLKSESLETAQELRLMTVERLDKLLMEAMSQALAGNLKAIDRCLKIEDMRAKLFGLYAPSQVKVNDWRTEIIDLIKTGQITIEEVEEEIGKDEARELLVSGGITVVEGSFSEEKGTDENDPGDEGRTLE